MDKRDQNDDNRAILEVLERERRKALVKKRIITIIVIAIVGWLSYTAASFGYKHAVSGQEMLIGGSFGAAALLFTGFWAFVIVRFCSGNDRDKISRVFKDKIVRRQLTRFFEDVTYEPNGRFPDEMIRGLDMVQGADRIRGNDLIHAKRGGVPFSQCDLLIEEEVVVEDSDGKRKKEYRKRFSGALIRIERPKAYPARVVLKTDKMAHIKAITGTFPLSALFGSGKATSNEVVTESVEFNRRYDLASGDQIAARILFTPHRMEAFMAMDKSISKEFALLFEGNHLVAFIQDAERFEVAVNSQVGIEDQVVVMARHAGDLANLIDRLVAVEE